MSILLTLIETHRYLILFLVNLLELIALPISGEVTMSYSGYLVYQGKLNYILTVLLATTGAIIGMSVSYYIGKRFGYNLILKYGKYIHFGPDKYNKTAIWFDNHGNKLLIFSYFIPGVRHFTGYFAGISRLPYRIFARNAYIGAFIWSLTFVTLGKLLGPQWDKFHHAASKYLGIGIVVLVLFISIIFLFRRNKISLKIFVNRYIITLSARFFTSFRGMKIFILCLSVMFLCMLILTFAIVQQYLNSELMEFNEVSTYLIFSMFDEDWRFIMNGLLLLQSPILLSIISIGSFCILLLNKRNVKLEAFFSATTILGGILFKEVITHIFLYLKPNAAPFKQFEFPNELSIMSLVVYGFFVFILIRHLKNKFFLHIRIITPFILLILLFLIGIANIYFSIQFPSDIIAGYTFGATWLFLNLLLLELLRIVQEKVKPIFITN